MTEKGWAPTRVFYVVHFTGENAEIILASFFPIPVTQPAG